MKTFKPIGLPSTDYVLYYSDGWTEDSPTNLAGFSRKDMLVYGEESMTKGYDDAIDHACMLLENISNESHYTMLEMFNNLIEKIKELK